jgi:hypothetical protein
LDLDRKRRLEDVQGWIWDPRAEVWEKGFRKLLEYVDAHGDALVPASYKADGYRLGAWVNTQRTRYSNRTLDTSRERRLEEVSGWTWRAAGT